MKDYIPALIERLEFLGWVKTQSNKLFSLYTKRRFLCILTKRTARFLSKTQFLTLMKGKENE